MPVPAFTRGNPVVGLPTGDTLGARGMGVGLTHHDAVAALCQREGTQRLLAVQIVAKQGPVLRGNRGGRLAYPAFARHLGTILLGRAIVRHAVFWREGHDLGMSGAHHHRGDRRVSRQGSSVRALTRKTVVAMERLRSKVTRAIKGASQVIPKAPAPVEQVVLFQTLKDREKDGVEMAGGHRLKERAHLVVTGKRLDAKQGLRVLAPLTGLELALGRHCQVVDPTS